MVKDAVESHGIGHFLTPGTCLSIDDVCKAKRTGLDHKAMVTPKSYLLAGRGITSTIV
jgi:hypothetical protein